jgi:hypothetical protein
MRILAIALSILLVLPAFSFAQPSPGDAGVFFDVEGTQTRRDVQPYQHFDIWVVLFDAPAGIRGYEFYFENPPEVVWIWSEGNAAGNISIMPTPFNYIIGTYECLAGTPSQWLVHADAMVFDVGLTDLTLCLAPARPSSFIDPAPGYLDCSDGLHRFGVAENGGGVYPDGCAVINPTQAEFPVAAPLTSWGSLKSRF